MKWRFEWVYRLGLATLLLVAFWAVWAEAQAPAGANAPGKPTSFKPPPPPMPPGW